MLTRERSVARLFLKLSAIGLTSSRIDGFRVTYRRFQVRLLGAFFGTARQSGSPPSAYDATRLLFRADVASHGFCIVCIVQVFAINSRGPGWRRWSSSSARRLVQTRTISACWGDGVVVSQPHLPVARAWQIFPSSCDLPHRQAARKCARRSPTSRSRERTGNAHALLHGYRRRSRHWPHLVGRRDYQACPSGQRGPAGAETAAHHRRGAGQERFGLLNCCVSCARTLKMVARGCQAAYAKRTASSF